MSGRDDEDRRLHPSPPTGRRPSTESDRESNNHLIIISASQAVSLSLPSLSNMNGANVVKLGQVERRRGSQTVLDLGRYPGINID